MEGCKPRFHCVGPNPRILPHEQVGVDILIHEGYSTVNFLQKESIMPCSSHRFSILVCHGTTSLALLCLPLAASDHLCLHSASSASTPLPPPPLCSNSNAYLCSSYDYVTPTLGLTTDRHWTHPDLLPTPRATVYIPLPHSAYFPDPFSLTIA